MKFLTVLSALAAIGSAQVSIQVNVGGAPTGTYAGDTGCGGTNFSIPGQVGIYSTLKYGLSFSCDIPAPNGSCIATLDLIENRAAGPNAVTDSAIGTRVFTASIQGTTGPTIDIFAAAGALTPYRLPLPAVAVTDGHLRLSFVASKGNAVLSGLDISCVPAPPPVLGVPCASLRPQTGVALVINLLDGSCLPVSLIPALGFIADNIQVWWFDKAGEMKVQSIFTILKPSQ